MGSAAAWALARRGVKALVFERFNHVHSFGSHGGKTRVIRHAYAEGADYVPLVQRADHLWQELEAVSGQEILVRTGGLDLAAPGYSHAQSARISAEAHGLPHQMLGGEEVRRRWPQFAIGDEWQACFSPDAGFLRVEPALRSLAAQARENGVTILERDAVLDWGADERHAWVQTTSGMYQCDRLIVTAGAWTSRILAELRLPLTVLRKILWWFEVEDRAAFAPERFPVFIAESAGREIYGLPISDDSGLKLAAHSGGDPVSPDEVDRHVHPHEIDQVMPFASTILKGVYQVPVESAVCLYVMTPDSDFILDRHPDWSHVVLGAGFSGHGFKFAPAIGEHLVELALDENRQGHARFALSRLMRTPSPA
ncbi:MAG: N-methyl-L-tryptophan oxidase [Chloroflexota bacterium]|nr:N-methyl-L-tryptophan oxidase [Chloroflexota bacterium]